MTTMQMKRSDESPAADPRERGILFTTEMSDAIGVNLKTETRRVVHYAPRPPDGATSAGVISSHLASNGMWSWMDGDPRDADTWGFLGKDFRCPYGIPGDHLYVREQFAFRATLDRFPPRDIWDGSNVWFPGDPDKNGLRGKWRRGMHMPKWATRIWLRVTDVRVERVQEISWRDAIAEGIKDLRWAKRRIHPTNGCVAQFAVLWDSINARRGYSWDSNPWVWVIQFERRT